MGSWASYLPGSRWCIFGREGSGREKACHLSTWLWLAGFSGRLSIKVVGWRGLERLGPRTPDAMLISEKAAASARFISICDLIVLS